MNTPRKETEELAQYLIGMADASEGSNKARKLERAAYWLQKVSYNVCGQGYVGCHGGDKCSSDHK